MSEIRKDELHPLNMVKGGEVVDVYHVNAKYDRVDFFPDLGCYILKIIDDRDGMMAVHLPEEDALRVVAEAELPLVQRDFMFQSEYEGYLIAEANMLDDSLFGGFDETVDGE